MTISSSLKRIYASAPKGQRYVDTLQLSHSAFPQTFYINNTKQNWTFDLGTGTLQLFEAVGFVVVFPTMDGKGQQDLQIAIDNVGRTAMTALELAAAQPREPIIVVVRTYINVTNSLPQNNPPLILTMTDVEVRKATISGVAGRSDILNRPFPSFIYRTDMFPGLDR